MATELTKAVRRQTAASIFEKQQYRNLIISIEPAGRDNAVIGIRAKGTRETYRIGVAGVYILAIQKHMQKIERRTKELIKQGEPKRRAASMARKELEKELKEIQS